jgi:hypothetical protein
MSNKLPFIKTSVTPLPNQTNYLGTQTYPKTIVEDYEKYDGSKYDITERWQGCVTVTHANKEHTTCKLYFSFNLATKAVLAEANAIER